MNINSDNWLEIINVEANINNNKIFSNLNLKLKLKEDTAIIGRNGSGKSSLVKLINRDLYPIVKSKSHIKLFGTELIDIWSVRKRVGFVFTDQEHRISPYSTIESVIGSGYSGRYGKFKGSRLNIDQKNTIYKILTQLGITTLRNKLYGSLSDGQKRIALIGRALVHEPEVLVLDEPISKLDINAKYVLLQLLNDLGKKGTTVVQITHDIETITENTKRLIFFKSGMIIADGTPKDLINSRILSNLFDINLEVINFKGQYLLIKK